MQLIHHEFSDGDAVSDFLITEQLAVMTRKELWVLRLPYSSFRGPFLGPFIPSKTKKAESTSTACRWPFQS